MKKIIFSREARIEKAIENWSVRGIARELGLELTYNEFPSISDQEIEVWENISEPWALNSSAFKRAFLEYFQPNGGE